MQRTVAAGYDADFALWVESQAAAIRDGRFGDVDIENVTEELEGLVRRDRLELRSRLATLMLHLLKLEYQPGRTSRSWRGTVLEQARKIGDLLDDSPSLKSRFEADAANAYISARKQAAAETGLPLATFPEEPPSAFERDFAAALSGDLTFE